MVLEQVDDRPDGCLELVILTADGVALYRDDVVVGGVHHCPQ